MTHVYSSIIKLRGSAQITIPKELRDQAHLREGDFIEARWTGSEIILRPVTVRPRDFSSEDAALIQDVVDQARHDYAAERHP